MKINHSKPYFDSSDSDSVLRTLESRFVSCGPLSLKFGESSAAYLGKKYGIPTQSGTDALTVALKSLNLPKGSEVAVPAYICSAPLDSLALCGLKPVPVDVDRETLSISVEKLNSGKDYPAVIAAHLFGVPAPLHLIENINVIEDCAQTLGCNINGRRVGSLGKLAICSFYATKLLTTGHGGLVAVDDPSLNESIFKLLDHDKQEKWEPHLHFLMSDLNASLGIAQLSKLDFMIEKRKEIAARFYKALGNKGDLPESIFSRFLVFPSEGEVEDIIEKFHEAGIESKRPVYKPLYKYLELDDDAFPNAKWAHENIISVPIYPALSEPEIVYIENFLENHKDDLCCWPSA